jgi:hypothetical protein
MPKTGTLCWLKRINTFLTILFAATTLAAASARTTQEHDRGVAVVDG